MPYEEIPKFHCIVEWPEYTGQAYALNLNNRIFKILAGLEQGCSDKKLYRIQNDIIVFYEVAGEFRKFLQDNKMEIPLNVAGKNFAQFDWDFLDSLPNWNKNIKFSQRVIDPAILCVDWQKDERMPNSNECKKRSNLNGEVTHNALDDAWDVISILRSKTLNYTI